MAALLGFIDGSHEKIKQGLALYQNISCVQNQDSTELTQENTLR